MFISFLCILISVILVEDLLSHTTNMKRLNVCY
jgi:hypothetical protein